MGGDPDQLARDVPRQHRVAVDRQHVADVRQRREIADRDHVARAAIAAQQAIQLLELAALALPSHPQAFAGVEEAAAVEEVEAAAGVVGVPAVELLDAGLRGVDDRLVARQRLRGGVGEVGEEREVQQRVGVGERLDLEVRHDLLGAGDAVEHGRDDDQRARAGREAVLEVEANEPARADAGGDQALHERGRELARRQEREQRRRKDEPDRAAADVRVPGGGGHARAGQEREHAEVDGRRVRERGGVHAGRPGRGARQARLERVPARADQVLADVRAARVGTLVVRGMARRLDGALGDRDLVLAPRARERLDDLPVAIARQEIHATVDARGIALQDVLDEARALEDLAPILGRAEPEAREHVRDRDLRGRLALGLLADVVLDRASESGEMLVEREAKERDRRAVLAQALDQLHDEGDARRVGELGQAVAFLRGVDQAQEGGRLGARRAGGQHRVGQVPEMGQERELQDARPRPQLADAERRRRLKGGEVAGDARRLEPSLAVRQQVLREQLDAGAVVAARGSRQAAMVAARQVVAHVSYLGLDHVEVVEQPFAGGRDRLAAMHVVGGRAIGRAQALLVLTKTCEVSTTPSDEPPAPRQRARAELQGERVRPLLELLQAQELGRWVFGPRRCGPTEKWSSGRRRSLPLSVI